MKSNDFIDEFEDKKKKLMKYDKAKDVLKYKDELIWSLIQEKKIQEEKEYALMKEKAKNEISDWKK